MGVASEKYSKPLAPVPTPVPPPVDVSEGDVTNELDLTQEGVIANLEPVAEVTDEDPLQEAVDEFNEASL